MTRSRVRKLKRLQARQLLTSVPVAAAILAGPMATAEESGNTILESVIVTAQKRAENLQDVPLSITALSTEKLEQLNVTDFDDYAKYMPSLSYEGFGPGFARVFFRGVSSGDNGNHSGSQPTVGQYLDEMPITTIQGALDVHIYDIARIEALAGPQGTLYGASSQAGTIRIITNKPELEKFSAGYDLEGSMLGGQGGYTVEGFVNLPINDRMAIRLVGWDDHTPGYISNRLGTREYPTAGITIQNPAFAKNDYNDVDTYGARAALRIDLNDSWTITPTVMGQKQVAHGSFAYDPSLGDLDIVKFRPEKSDDRWGQAALTVEGKIGNLDLVYAGGFLKRDVDTQSDYSDYSYFYDVLYNYVWYNDAGDVIDPTQYIQGKDRYQRQSHELRLSSPSDWRVRFVTGLYYQRQQHGIEQRYKIDDLMSDYEVTGWPDTIWLTEQQRVDRDYAVFGEVTFDITQKLSATVGARIFRADNSLEGFYGFAEAYSGSGTNGETRCSILAGDERFDRTNWEPFNAVGTAPCKNLDKRIRDDDWTPKLNLTYRINQDVMVYATYSEGFRPGGVNRRGDFPPYDPDFLKNYEIGWKTTLANNRLRFNGALFMLDWDDFQYSFTGAQGLTNVTNAGGARIKGIEADVEWAATDHLILSGGLTVLDAKLTQDFCQELDADTGVPLPADQCLADPDSPNPLSPFAPKGTKLPVVPDFKGNVTARYSFPVGTADAFVQGSFVYQDGTNPALLPDDNTVLGTNDAYGIADFSAGFAKDSFNFGIFVSNAFDERASLSRFVQCRTDICDKPYILTNQPRTYGVKFGQKF
ncbi:MAG TPA: TonB-dependent receptor [Povalibacter sp.]|nr:TonB-dependent receptor [Povalibacter sp.]